jgi:hypothetical protein
MTKLQNLLKGKTVQLNPQEIGGVISNVGMPNYKKLLKAYKNNKGCRLCLGGRIARMRIW